MRLYQVHGVLSYRLVDVIGGLSNFLDNPAMLSAANFEFDHPETARYGFDRGLSPNILGHTVWMQDNTVEKATFTAPSIFKER